MHAVHGTLGHGMAWCRYITFARYINSASLAAPDTSIYVNEIQPLSWGEPEVTAVPLVCSDGTGTSMACMRFMDRWHSPARGPLSSAVP